MCVFSSVGGLIQAYKGAAKLALENASIVERTVNIRYQLHFEYPEMNKVMRTIKEYNLDIVDQKLALDCTLDFEVRKKDAPSIYALFQDMFKVTIKAL